MKRLFFLFAVLLAHPLDAISQTSIEQHPASRSVNRMDQTASVTQPCDYDTCALRLKSTVGAWEIVKGLDGKTVATLGLRPPNLASIVGDVPEAAEQARLAQRRYARTSAMIWAGAALGVIGILFDVGSEMHLVGRTVGAIGIASLAYGGYEHPKNIDLFSKSIWLYNKALKR